MNTEMDRLLNGTVYRNAVSISELTQHFLKRRRQQFNVIAFSKNAAVFPKHIWKSKCCIISTQLTILNKFEENSIFCVVVIVEKLQINHETNPILNIKSELMLIPVAFLKTN